MDKRAKTIKEKKAIINRLYEVWNANPELRLGQLIENTFTGMRNLYFIEDFELIERLEGYYK